MLELIDSVVEAAYWMATPEGYVIPLVIQQQCQDDKRWAGYEGRVRREASFSQWED